MTIASYITILRIILITPILYLSYQTDLISDFLALLLFIVAGLTDYFDGYYARKTKTETSLGALLDLLADKLLVCIVLIWLVFLSDKVFLIFPVLLIISRELIVSSLRQYIVEKIGQNPVRVTNIAKSKTTLQFIAISFLIISPQMNFLFNQITVVLIWVAAFISLYSLIKYFKAYENFIELSGQLKQDE